MSIRIFRTAIVIAVLLWIYLLIAKDEFLKSALLRADSLSFLVLSLTVHGVMIHYILPTAKKGQLIKFQTLMWVFWAIMFLVFCF